jgi:hypothetical protein
MPSRSDPTLRAVKITELPDFEADAARLFNEPTLRALHLLLADNPLAGVAVKEYPGLFLLEFMNVRVLYSLSRKRPEVFLLGVLEGSTQLPDPASEEGKLLGKAVKAAVGAGIVLGARALVKEIWEWLVENMPWP